MEKYPIPTHLKDILVVDESCSDIHDIEGKIVCVCGGDKFRILQNENHKRSDHLPYGEWDGIKINAICEKCGKTYLLFDQATQGYDGFVCHDFKTASDDNLTSLKCKKCGKEVFSVKLGIEVEDKEQFEECVTDYPDEFSPEDFVNAFNWITVDTCCDSCKSNDEWISLELA